MFLLYSWQAWAAHSGRKRDHNDSGSGKAVVGKGITAKTSGRTREHAAVGNGIAAKAVLRNGTPVEAVVGNEITAKGSGRKRDHGEGSLGNRIKQW